MSFYLHFFTKVIKRYWFSPIFVCVIALGFKCWQAVSWFHAPYWSCQLCWISSKRISCGNWIFW